MEEKLKENEILIEYDDGSEEIFEILFTHEHGEGENKKNYVVLSPYSADDNGKRMVMFAYYEETGNASGVLNSDLNEVENELLESLLDEWLEEHDSNGVWSIESDCDCPDCEKTNNKCCKK